MIQFLRFDQDSVRDRRFVMPAGAYVAKFFLKRVLYLFLFVYSTLFIAAAIPFFKTPFMPAYLVGSMATTIFLMRFFNHLMQYLRFGPGSIEITSEGISVQDKKQSFRVPADQISYLEVNLLGNLLIREKYNVTTFPIVFLTEEERKELLGMFQDMSPKRTGILKKIWEMLDAVAVALVLAVHIIQYIVQAYYIPTGSMKDTLLVGDHLFVEKITYGPVIPAMLGMEKPLRLKFLSLRDLERGDIVIFTPPHEQDKDYIKRCIALPGDRFEIKNGNVYINGKKIDEPYVKGFTEDPYTKSRVQGIIPEGKVVVLGDNRMNSQDGRFFGYLDISAIKGRAFILYWNTEQVTNFDFSRFGLIR